MKKRRALVPARAAKLVQEPFESLLGRMDVPSSATMEARLLRMQNIVMTCSEQGVVIPRFMDLARQVNLALRIEYTLKGIRKEGGDARADSGSAVRRYAAQFEAKAGPGESGDDPGAVYDPGYDSGPADDESTADTED